MFAPNYAILLFDPELFQIEVKQMSSSGSSGEDREETDCDSDEVSKNHGHDSGGDYTDNDDYNHYDSDGDYTDNQQDDDYNHHDADIDNHHECNVDEPHDVGVNDYYVGCVDDYHNGVENHHDVCFVISPL